MSNDLRPASSPLRGGTAKRMSVQVEPQFMSELNNFVLNKGGTLRSSRDESPIQGGPPPLPQKPKNLMGEDTPTTPPSLPNKPIPPKRSGEPTSLLKKPDKLPPPVPPPKSLVNSNDIPVPPPLPPKNRGIEENVIVTVAFVELQTTYSLGVTPNQTTGKTARSMIIKKVPNWQEVAQKYDNQFFYRIESEGSTLVTDNDILVIGSGKIFAFCKKEIIENLHNFNPLNQQKKGQSNRAFASLRGNRSSSPDATDQTSQAFLLQFIKKFSSQESNNSNNVSSSNSAPSVVATNPPVVGDLPPTPPQAEEKVDNPISELVSTERSFIYDLDLMIQYFVKELTEKNVLPVKTVSDMFLNIENVSKLHKEIYKRLQQNSTVGGIADIFGLQMIQEIERVYTIYLGHYEQALALFYSLREKSSNFIKFLTRMNEEPIFKDKSLKNLLVTPMQRICKYELLLNSIAAKERKLNANNITPELEDNLKKLLLQAQILNATLLKIDQKRSEADKWASVIKLEEKLSTSEPLRKRGRYIAKEAELIVYNLLNQDEQQRCYVVLFNDIFLRAKMSKNNNRVLEMTPLRQYILFDKQCQFCTENCINIASLDPRGHVLRIELPDKKEKEKWTQSFEKLTAKQERLSKQWDMGSDIELGTLLSADKCQWDHAYVQHCRMFITSRHMLLAWEAFGSWERESIKLRDIESATMSGDDKLTLTTANWKGQYQFTGLRRLKQTHEILETAMLEQAVMEAKGVSIKGFENVKKEETILVDQSYSPCCDLQFLKLSDEEWTNIWNGDEIAYKPGDVILSHDSKSSNLYQVVTGSVTVKSKSDKQIAALTAGEFFGLSNFLTASPSNVNFICGEEGASVLTISRPIVLQHLKDEPVLLGKFFALLACKMSDQTLLFHTMKKKEKKGKKKTT